MLTPIRECQSYKQVFRRRRTRNTGCICFFPLIDDFNYTGILTQALDPEGRVSAVPVSYTHLTLPTTPYV